MLEIGQLQAFYGPAQALFGVDLQLRAGQLLVLQGLNGAGKSTLLKAVMGLEVSSRGQLLLGGPGPAPAQDISVWPTHRWRTCGWPAGVPVQAAWTGSLTALACSNPCSSVRRR